MRCMRHCRPSPPVFIARPTSVGHREEVIAFACGFIGRKRPSDTYWEVWKVRAIEGHSIVGLKKIALGVPFIPDHVRPMPCVAHGTKLEAAHSIL